MKKIFSSIIFFLLLNFIPALATEEVILEREKLNLGEFGNYLSDVYYGKVENAPVILKLFSEKGLEFENSKINTIKLHLLYSSEMRYVHNEHGEQLFNHDFAVVEPKFSIDFNDKKTQFMFDINLLGELPGYSNWLTQRIRQLSISHKITPNQTLALGQYWRLPNTYDGSRGIYIQDLVLKSQLGRILGNVSSVGIRNLGNYKYINYDIGLYDSTRFMQKFGNGLDFTGHIMLKPLANYKEKIGDFKIGAGYNIGKNDISYSQYSFFAGYDIEKFHIKVEYASADGYNGVYQSRNCAQGFYTTLAYDINPKISILGRYDIFDKNIHSTNDTLNEYTIGLTFKPYKNMKLLLNYVFTTGNNQPNSNAILFATRFFI